MGLDILTERVVRRGFGAEEFRDISGTALYKTTVLCMLQMRIGLENRCHTKRREKAVSWVKRAKDMA